MNFEHALAAVIAAFRDAPNRWVIAPATVLLAGIRESVGTWVAHDRLRTIIRQYLYGGALDAAAQRIYDAAVQACHKVAQVCFGSCAQCEIYWIEQIDGRIAAEVRPA